MFLACPNHTFGTAVQSKVFLKQLYHRSWLSDTLTNFIQVDETILAKDPWLNGYQQKEDRVFFFPLALFKGPSNI